ncbi:MAG TPA: helix-turn-helix domain-containing protein [Pseudolysinimonas sp.]|nr:helix-turn-helix domain-containing protein [Pseudolysinimonas sp.]
MTAPTPFETREFSEFRSAVSESFVPLQVRSDNPGRFGGRIRIAQLDDVHVSEVSAREHWVERTPELISRGGDQRYFKLSLQIAGSGLLIQDNREALLHPGDIAVYDTGRPYSLVFEDDFRMMVVMFPQTLLDLPADSVGEITAVRFPGGEGLAGMIAPFLEQMANGIEKLAGPTGTRLAHNAIDLVTTMFASELGALSRQGGHRALTGRIRAYIEENLGDPRLDPARIAAAHYISTRHLHGIFREEGTTVSTWVRTRRLEHCRRDLIDPLLADRPIGSIAARWGFIDAAHFSRLFKATFGRSPSEVRATLG